MEQKKTKAPPMEGTEEAARPQSIHPIPRRFIAIRTHHQLPPNPYRGDSGAGVHHHPIEEKESTNTREKGDGREKGSAPSSRPGQNIADDNPHIPGGPPVHWKKRVFEASPTREGSGEEAWKRRATICREGQLEEGGKVNRDIWQGGLGGRNQPEMGRKDEQSHVWDEAEWYQERDGRNRRYAYFQSAGPSNQQQQQQHIHPTAQLLETVRGQQCVWDQGSDVYHIPDHKLPGPSDGTAMGKLLKRIEVQRKIGAVREGNAAWKYYDEAKADQSHLRGSPQSRDCNDEEFLVATEGSLLCGVCLVEVAPLERSFHVGLWSHMIKVERMKEELAWFEDV